MKHFFLLRFLGALFAIIVYPETIRANPVSPNETLRSIKAKWEHVDPILITETAATNILLFSSHFLHRFQEWETHYVTNGLEQAEYMEIFDNEAYWILVNAGPCILSNLAPLTSTGRFSAAGFLWLKTTRTRAVEDENPWFDEPLNYLWKAGTACADKRVLFLLSEWRTAIRENRAEDANHAKLALIAQGIFAYHALFREIELGREDAWIILENTDMPYPGMRRMNHEEWMVWWRDHQSEYTFKLQDPKTDQSPHLEKWRRLGK